MMKNTCITRPIDQLGRIVIPKELRENMDIAIKDYFEFSVDDKKGVINLRLLQKRCSLCKEEKELVETKINDRKICRDCIEKLQKQN